MSKERLDVLLVNKGLATSREKAKAIIMSGNVYVDGQKEDKAGQSFPDTAVIEVRGTTLKYVSRGGLKLEKAMQNFDVTLEGKICMDVGSSTGGFTDCMLQNGAIKVYAVDVGHGQLDWKLRNDERVVCMEKTNIRYVTPDDVADRIHTKLTPAYSAVGTFSGSSSKIILPIITPCSRSTLVSSRVSMPVMPGTCSRLSHSARLSTAFQWQYCSL